MPRLARKAVQPIIQLALREDAASSDATSRAVIPASRRIRARIVAKAAGIIAGGPVAAWTFQTVDPSLRCALKCRDGSRIGRGRTVLAVEGRARSIFAAERTALNLLGHLSGIATLTTAYVAQTKGTRAKIYDTRKTLAGLRALEKHAVRVGGGHSHRASLAEAILIKTNHLVALRKTRASDQWPVASDELMQKTLTKAKRSTPKQFVEVEVTNVRELTSALRATPDAILLDNWTVNNIRKAILLRNSSPLATRHSPLLEVSGGVSLENVRSIARTGVDRISIGRLTHSAPSLDVSLEVV